MSIKRFFQFTVTIFSHDLKMQNFRIRARLGMIMDRPIITLSGFK